MPAARKESERTKSPVSKGKSAMPVADLACHPLSFDMAEVFDEQQNAPGLTKGQRTLLKVKAAVARALEQTPYQMLRISDVADQAQISYGLFYHYYKDKERATVEVLLDFLEHLEKTYAQIHVSDDDYASLYQPNLFYLDVNRRNAGLIRACLTVSEEVESFREQYTLLIDRWHRRMAQSIRRNQKTTDELLPDAELVAYGVGGMIDQYCRQVYAQQNPFLSRLIENTHHFAETVSIMWYRAVYGRSPTKQQILNCRPDHKSGE